MGLKEIKEELAHRINIKGIGTTGSGRELIGELIGADVIKDEITAHKTGASFISKKYFNEDVDTIFEIGGQDSKYISVDKGVVVDFHMNEACSAGTGSFLQEQAEKLGVQIKGEFAKLALESKAPINLGERCTVFIEKDLNNFQQKGAKLEDLLSGLAYSVVHNYLNRVVRGRKIGRIIYFQGGTAYNDAVAAAFSKVLNKRVIVPPHNGVMGAVGMALVAKEKFERTKSATSLEGMILKK
jgi:predicted CoA-substrate-specific enzyme activase